MAYLKRAETGATKLIITSPNAELLEMDEVVFAGTDSGVYRLLSFDETASTVKFERVDSGVGTRLEVSLDQIEKRFGDSIRITSPQSRRAHA